MPSFKGDDEDGGHYRPREPGQLRTGTGKAYTAYHF